MDFGAIKERLDCRDVAKANELVFMNRGLDAVPFTTSEVIAEYAGVKRHAVQVLLEKHREDFETFGRVSFQMRPLPTKGGMQEHKVYLLNEEQATLLITYLKNTPKVREFKKELVRQFYIMRKELVKREINRAKMLPTRRELTDSIRDCIPESPHKSMWYKNYTDLAYRMVTGMSAAQLRALRNVGKDTPAADFLTSEEMDAVRHVSGQLSVLIEMGMDYKQIKKVMSKCRLSTCGK